MLNPVSVVLNNVEVSATTPFPVTAGSGATAQQVIVVDGAGVPVVYGTPTDIGGDVAAGATDSGKPVKMGGKAQSGFPATVSVGQRVDAWFNQYGHQGVVFGNTVVAADNMLQLGLTPLNSTSATGAPLGTQMYGFDPTASRSNVWRSNFDATLLASGAFTATQTGADQTNHNGKGVKVVVDVTAVTSSSLTVKIQGKDVASGKYYDILTGAALVGTGTVVMTVYPGATVAANVAVSDVLPKVWRIVATKGDASSWTASIGATVLL